MKYHYEVLHRLLAMLVQEKSAQAQLVGDNTRTAQIDYSVRVKIALCTSFTFQLMNQLYSSNEILIYASTLY